jgi:hypothetical protein
MDIVVATAANVKDLAAWIEAKTGKTVRHF